jgi:hypothetical protein
MTDEKSIRDKVHQLTDALLRLERYLASYAQYQVYCGRINNWKGEVKDSLSTMNDQIKDILKQLK